MEDYKDRKIRGKAVIKRECKIRAFASETVNDETHHHQSKALYLLR
jgi:hypothetical protein